MSQKMRFTVPTTKGTQEVEGRLVVLAGYEDFQLYVHRAITTPSKYTITELTTGLSLSADFERHTSQTATIEALKAKFERYSMTPAKLQQMIDSQGAHHRRKRQGSN
jgi:hypothetical protein